MLSGRAGFEAVGAVVVPSLEAALARVVGREAWVVGGGAVYAAAISTADRLEVTELDAVVAGDTCAPRIDDSWVSTGCDPDLGWHISASGERYRFVTYRRAPGADDQASVVGAT